jgi:hypothetical protein
VDGAWVTNESAPKESDGAGNFNNVLNPDDIKETLAGLPTLSSAAPASSTAALAGIVPKNEKSKSAESIPGAFPLTPLETPSNEPKAFSIDPIPATAGFGNPIQLAPGEQVPHPSTLTTNTIDSTVKHDKEPAEETISVAPIPATAGLGNPIYLAPGEEVPHPSTLTEHTIASTATTDPASYEKSDSLPPQLGPIVTPEAERSANGGLFGDLSSIPGLAGLTTQSAAPTSTTAGLAGAVPLEPRNVPETVTESQKEAGFAPEAAANPEAVVDKKQMEQELKAMVPEEPAAAESTVAGKAAAIAAAGAVAAAGTFAAVKETAAETVGLNDQTDQTATEAVPEVVAESQREAHASPEAAANPEAVVDKKQMEQELKAMVPEEPAAAESTIAGKAAAVAAAGAATAAGTFAAVKATAGLNDHTAAEAVPEVVAESQREAHASPEAAANSEAVHEKSAVESELLREIPKANETGEPAPAIISPAVIATTSNTALAVPEVPEVVVASQIVAHASPEAASNPEAVHEKSAVESELLREVTKTNEAGEPAPTLTAATSTTAPVVSGAVVSGAAVSEVPEVVAESQKEAHASPEAASNPEAVHEKKAVESELLKEVTKTNEAGEPAPTVTAATIVTAPGEEALTDAQPLKPASEPGTLNAPASKPALPETSMPVDDSRDVSPMSKPATKVDQPTVTTGVNTTTADTKTAPETPESSKATPRESVDSSAAADKKKKRRSIFGKIKDKLSSSKS